jgi:hypothetical protein
VDLVERVSETDVGDRTSFAAAVFVRENSEKQRKTAGDFAVISADHHPEAQDFCGERGGAR